MMRVKFWGVRGSVPTPLLTEQYQDKLFAVLQGAGDIDLKDPVAVRDYIARLPHHIGQLVGGNTTCVEINIGDELVIIDAGSGIRPLGVELMSREFGRGHGMAHIFFTHAHWDHLQGLPFFAPFYVPGNHFVLYAVNHSPHVYLSHQQTAPTYFPVPIESIPARLEYVQLDPNTPVQIAGTTISTMPLYHPGIAQAYRFENEEGTFVFASDGEYQILDDSHLEKYIRFFQNADALVFDTQYSLRDVFMSRVDWGHSSATIGVDIAERAKVKKLYTFHYDHSDSDRHIYEVAEAAQTYASLSPIDNKVAVLVAYEGLELFIGQDTGLTITADSNHAATLLSFSGRMHADTIASAQTTLTAALGQTPRPKLIFDLTALIGIDMPAALALIKLVRSIPTAQVAFVSPIPAVRRTLEKASVNLAGHLYYRRQHAFAALLGPSYLQLDLNVLGGRYTLGDVLVADESGTTFAATRLADDSPCVVQVRGDESTASERRQFAELARQWCHATVPGLLLGHEVIETDNHVIFIGDREPQGILWLDWMVQHHRRLPLMVALQTLEQILHVVRNAHQQGVVHGALRPECMVMVNNAPHLSRVPLGSGNAMPASSYSSPEQLCGADISLHSDLFAIAVMWYEALVGVHPFSAESEEMVLAQQLRGTPLTMRVFRPDLTPAVQQFFERMLSADPELRFSSAQAVLEALPQLVRASAV